MTAGPFLTLAWAEVAAVDGGRPEAQRLCVRMEGADAPAKALAYPAFCGGPIGVGERVLLNTTACDLGLGSGGFHLVVAVAGRTPVRHEPGHIVKLRYTPLQIAVRAAAEPGMPGHPALAAARSLHGMPVVAGSLHAQVAPAVIACHLTAPALRVAYVMTDGGALPAALLDEVHELRHAGVLTAVISCGHAFGGDLESVSLPGALMAARHIAGCHVAIAAMGPGAVGTATAWDTSALEMAAILDCTAGLGGRPLAMARVSFADARRRHHGVSHHTRTALGLVRSPALLAAPPGTLAALLREAVARERHTVVEVGDDSLFAAVRAALPGHRTMGRGWDLEGPLFRVAAAAGALAAGIAQA